MQTVQFDKSISLAFLVFLALEVSLATFFVQLAQYLSIAFFYEVKSDIEKNFQQYIS